MLEGVRRIGKLPQNWGPGGESTKVKFTPLMKNVLSIDVEDYYHVSGLKSVIRREDWGTYPQRVVENTQKILRILDTPDVKATFFILGIVAEQHPKLVEEIHEAGHEVASHGYGHQLVYDQTESQFRRDLLQSKHILEAITGKPVLGYRAPSFSIIRTTLWALDVLLELGFRYDSSIFPIQHDRYGIPSAQRFPYIVHRNGADVLWEFPPCTYKLFGKNIPMAGGGYFRFFPYRLTKSCIRSLNQQGLPAMVYLHPWELDPDQPRFKPELKNRFRHYINLDKTEPRLKQLLRDFQLTTVLDIFNGKRGK